MDYNETDFLERLLDLGCEPWNSGMSRVEFHEEASRTARILVELCGKDPNVATACDMDDFNVRFLARDIPLSVNGWYLRGSLR